MNNFVPPEDLTQQPQAQVHERDVTKPSIALLCLSFIPKKPIETIVGNLSTFLNFKKFSKIFQTQ